MYCSTLSWVHSNRSFNNSRQCKNNGSSSSSLLRLYSFSSCNDIRFETTVVNKQIPFWQRMIQPCPRGADALLHLSEAVQDEASLKRLQQIFNGTFFGDIQYDALSPEDAIPTTPMPIVNVTALSPTVSTKRSNDGWGDTVWYWYTLDIRTNYCM